MAYVRGGGTLVCGFGTGVVDEDDRVRPGGMDERLRGLFGIRTLHEWWPLEPGTAVEAEGGLRGTLWSEELEPDGTADETLAYRGGELDGLPAVLRKGRAWYVSTLPEPDALRDLLTRVAAGAVRPVLDGLPDTVEAVRRGGLLFLLHHGRGEVAVDVPGTHRDLLTGATVTGRITLGRYGAAVLEP